MIKHNYFSLILVVLLFLNHATSAASNEIRDVWNHKASQWAEFVGNGGEKDLNRKFQVDPALLSAAGNLTGKVVLDAGSGTGYFSARMAKSAKKVIAVDISDEMIKIAKKQHTSQNIDFLVGDLSKLEKLISTKSVDIILSNHVLMDLPDLEATTKEFRRILRPGGKLVFAILHPCFPLNVFNFNGENGTYAWQSSYFESGKTLLSPFSDNFDTNFIIFHRPLSVYIATMLKNGFSLTEMTEPVIAEENKDKLDPLLFKRFKHTPVSIILAFEKKR